jgi:hypothetical protein
MRLALLLATACGGVAFLAACGTEAAKPPRPAPERQWSDNAAVFIDNLGSSLQLSANGGGDLASARRALQSNSDIYAMLVAYTRFGGCAETLRNVGVPTRRFHRVARTLRLACNRLERSASLFTRAMQGSDPRLLLAATHTALGASPLLYQAKVELDAVRPQPS